MKRLTRLRRATDEFASDTIRQNLLNKLPEELKDRLFAEGGDIEVDIDSNCYTVRACSKALSDEVALFLIQSKFV